MAADHVSIKRIHFTDCVHSFLLKVSIQSVKVVVVNTANNDVTRKVFVFQLDYKKITSSCIYDGDNFYFILSEFT